MRLPLPNRISGIEKDTEGSPNSPPDSCFWMNNNTLVRYSQEAEDGILEIAAAPSLKCSSSDDNGLFLWVEKAWRALSSGFLEERSSSKLPVQRGYEFEVGQDYSLAHRSCINSIQMLHEAAVGTVCNLSEPNMLVPWRATRGFFLQVGTISSSRLAQNLTVHMKLIESQNIHMGGFTHMQKHPAGSNSALSVWDSKRKLSSDGNLEAPNLSELPRLQKHSPLVKAAVSEHPPGIKAAASICNLVRRLSTDGSFQARRKQFLPLPKMVLQEVMDLISELKRCKNSYPDKQKLHSVQDFFQYTERESRHLFEELDRDKDGQVTLEDLKAVMCKRKLPSAYAKDFLRRTHNHLFTKSFGWDEFFSFVQEKEPMVISLYNSLGINKSGTLQINHVKSLLLTAGLPAADENAVGMMNFLGADAEGFIKYDQFRRFMMLLPTQQLATDPWAIWFKAAMAFPAPSVAPKTFISASSSGIQLSQALTCIQSIPSAGMLSSFISNGARSLSSLVHMEHCKHTLLQNRKS